MELRHKLLAHLLWLEAGLVKPWVRLELVDRVAVASIVAKELQDHVLEVS